MYRSVAINDMSCCPENLAEPSVLCKRSPLSELRSYRAGTRPALMSVPDGREVVSV